MNTAVIIRMREPSLEVDLGALQGSNLLLWGISPKTFKGVCIECSERELTPFKLAQLMRSLLMKGSSLYGLTVKSDVGKVDQTLPIVSGHYRINDQVPYFFIKNSAKNAFNSPDKTTQVRTFSELSTLLNQQLRSFYSD